MEKKEEEAEGRKNKRRTKTGTLGGLAAESRYA